MNLCAKFTFAIGLLVDLLEENHDGGSWSQIAMSGIQRKMQDITGNILGTKLAL